MMIDQLQGTPDAWTFRRFGKVCAELGIEPRHVLHVGGHLGQEVEHYRAAGVERITYMEPTPECAAHLRTLGDDVHVIEAAASVSRGSTSLQVCGGDGCWNTIRGEIGDGPGVHAEVGVVQVEMIPVRDVQRMTDEVEQFAPDVLVVDTQGTEVEALRSADIGPSTALRLIVVETQSSGHPEAAHRREVDEHLAARGWYPAHAWNHEYADRPHATFMDVFYVPASTYETFARTNP